MSIRDMERQIAASCIADLLAAGYTVSVNDGGETTLRKSCDPKAILEAMFTTGEDILIAHDSDRRVGTVWFIYGNDGWDVIADYSVSLDSVIAPTTALIERLSD